MKNERLLDAFGQIEDEFIEEADPERKKNTKKKSSKSIWVKWGTLAACALVVVAVGVPQIFRDKGVSGESEEPQLEGNIADTTAGRPETEEGAMVAEHAELRIHIEELNENGFSGSVVYGTGIFEAEKYIDVIFQGHAYVINSKGQIFEYDESNSNIDELELAVGDDVDVLFHADHYEEAKDGSLSVFAYRIEDDNDTNYGETIPNSTSGIVVNTLKEPINMMLPNLREDIRTPMTNEELYEYYDTDFADALNKVAIFEEREGSIPKGIYTYADGSIFDMNQFVYYQAEMNYELYVNIGRNTRCSQLVSNMDADAQSCEINGVDVMIFKTENSGEVVYYATFELSECDYIISGMNMDEDVFEKILGSIIR